MRIIILLLLLHVHVLLRRTIPLLNLDESVLEQKKFPPLERVESTRCLFPVESTLGTDRIGVTPDAASLTENQDDMVEILLVMNLEYR